MLHKTNRLVDIHTYVRSIILLPFKVLPEVEIIFPDPVPSNAQQAGICQAKSWPRVTNDLHVETGDGCAITRGPVMRNDNYTAAVYFTLNYVNSSCQQITCRNAYDTKTSSINTSKYYNL